MPFHCSPTYHDIVYSFTITEEEHKSEFELTKYTPYIMLKDELWVVYCESWGKINCIKTAWHFIMGQIIFSHLVSGTQYTISFHFKLKMMPSLKMHYSDVIMCAMTSQITNLTTVYSTIYSGAKKTPKLHVTGLCAGNSLVTWTKLSIWP